MAALSNDKVGKSQPQVKCFSPSLSVSLSLCQSYYYRGYNKTFKACCVWKSVSLKKKNNLLVATHAMAYTWAS